MTETFYLYSQESIHNIIKEALSDFEVHKISMDIITIGSLKNKNVLMVLKDNFTYDIKESFFLNNNVVVFFSKENKADRNKYFNAKIFCGYTNIKRFIDEVKTCFASKPYVFKNIKIWGEKITNIGSGQEYLLTPLEKDILIILLEKQKIERQYLLEKVLKIRKDTETKTIESHLTRIRKKLLKINIQIEITSKDNMIYLYG